MPRSTFFALFVVLLSTPSYADRTERVVRKDGAVITGEVIGFRDGCYLVKTGSTVVEIATQDVRTILRADAPIENPAIATRTGDRLTHRTVLDALPLRRHPQVSADHQRLFEECAAQVIRGEWDLALRGLRQLLDREPDWIEPQILRAIIAGERGELDEALGVALLLSQEPSQDALAHRVSAEVFRLAGFSHRYAETLERVILDENTDGPVHRLLTALWWPIDRERASQHWDTYVGLDPNLSWPGCEEGDARRRVEQALTVEDWGRADVAFSELVRRFPWAVAQARFLEAKVLESRLKSAEAHGRLEEAVLCCEALAKLSPDRVEEWRARLDGLRAFLLSRACESETFDDLARWCRLNAHLLGTELDDWRKKLSARFQDLGLQCLARGEIQQARACMVEARRWDEWVRPADLDAAFEEVAKRMQSDVRLGRESRAFEICRVLGESYPERAEGWRRAVSDALEASLASLERKDLDDILEHVRVAFVALPPVKVASAVDPGVGDPAPSAVTPAETPAETVAYADALLRDSLARYFPQQLGTRWVYQCPDGTHEERTIVDVRTDESGSTRVRFKVTGPAGGESELLAFVKGSDVLLHSPLSPPGEIALRYPLTDEATWSWQKEIFLFERMIDRDKVPLQLPLGTFTDYFVVRGENSIPGGPGATSHRTRISVTYVAGLGIAKIEAENPALGRTLIEFHPPPSAQE